MKVITNAKKPNAVPKVGTIRGKCYSNKYPTDHLFIRVDGYNTGFEGFVNLVTGMFTPLDECCSHWYPVDASAVVE